MSYIQPNQNMQPQNQPLPQQRPCYQQRSAVDVPIMSSKEQTQMWQQNTYLVDSGIHSGTSSQVPSIAGKEEEMDLFDLDTHRFTQGHDDITQPSSVFPPDTESIKQDAVFMDCQEDTDSAAARVIPQLTRLLGDEDQVVVSQAAMMIHQLSRKTTFRHAIVNSDAMMAALVHTLQTSNDLETMKGAVGAIHKLSIHRHGLVAVMKSGGIPALVHLLSSEVENILFLTITTLHNLLLHQEGAKNAVRMAGGAQKLVTLLRRNNLKFLIIVTDCLHILAYSNQDTKLMILASDGSSELVRIMRSYDYEKLLWTTSRVLKVLSVCSSNKPAIIESGGLMALAKHLRSPNSSLRLVQNCLWTLRNLSDAATKVTGLDDLLMALVEVLQMKDVQAVTCASGILSNLTCNNEWNKKVVYEIGGIEALIQTILVAGDREDITEPLVCTLRHLTSKSGFADRARRSLVEGNGVHVIVKLLNSPCSWPLVKAVIGLVRNVALVPDNVTVLRECGMVHNLVQLVGRAAQDLPKKVATNKGVKMEDVVEGTVSTLYIMSRDSFVRAIVRQQMIIPILIQLLYNESENIQRAAISLLSQLSTDKDGAVMIEQEGAVPILTELTQSRNEVIVSFATTTLCHIHEDRTNKRSPNSLNSLFQEDGLWNPDFEMVAELQEILSSDQNYGYNQDGAGMHNNNQTFNQQGFDQVSVEISGLDSGNSSSYSALLEAMEVTMADTDPDLNFAATINQMPSTPQDNQTSSSDWAAVPF